MPLKYRLIECSRRVMITINQPILIYRVRSLKTDQSYVGQTSRSLETRITEHCEGRGSQPLFKDILKHGSDNFVAEVVAVCYENPDSLEDHYIEHYNALHPHGYNLRLNREITPNDDPLDYNITGTFIKRVGVYACFHVGEWTESRAYQRMINIRESMPPDKKNLITKKTYKGSPYVCILVYSNLTFCHREKYNLRLHFDGEQLLI